LKELTCIGLEGNNDNNIPILNLTLDTTWHSQLNQVKIFCLKISFYFKPILEHFVISAFFLFLNSLKFKIFDTQHNLFWEEKTFLPCVVDFFNFLTTKPKIRKNGPQLKKMSF
jgi:hypothetical protein